MSKQISVVVVLVVLVSVSSFYLSSTLQGDVATELDSLTAPTTAVERMAYGRLVFEGENYNWIEGDQPLQKPTTIRNLITRLGGKARHASFATLLDTLGGRGWELVFETEDPEGFGKVLIFRRVY